MVTPPLQPTNTGQAGGVLKHRVVKARTVQDLLLQGRHTRGRRPRREPRGRDARKTSCTCSSFTDIFQTPYTIPLGTNTENPATRRAQQRQTQAGTRTHRTQAQSRSPIAVISQAATVARGTATHPYLSPKTLPRLKLVTHTNTPTQTQTIPTGVTLCLKIF